jgi:hypothetical protein
VCVLLGTATTVVVAGVFGWFQPGPFGGVFRATRIGNDVISFNDGGNWGVQRFDWFVHVEELPDFVVTKLAGHPGDTMPYWTSIWKSGAIESVRAEQMPGSGMYPGQSDLGEGWPLIAFHGYSEVPTASLGPAMQKRVGMVDLGFRLVRSGSGGMVRVQRSIGYLPVWPGLIADSLLYAAGWWGVIAGVGVLLAKARRRAGTCTFCGYSLEGLRMGMPCPECGRERAGANSAANPGNNQI